MRLIRQKKAINFVLVSILVLAFTIVSLFSFRAWYNNYYGEIFSKYEGEIEGDEIVLEKLDGNYLYVRNYAQKTVDFTKLEIADMDCSLNGTISPLDFTLIGLGNCTSNMSLGIKDILLFTDVGLFERDLVLETEYTPGLTVYFATSGICDFAAGYTEIYSLNDLTDAHAEIASESNFVYTVCLRHPDYLLGTSCSGNYIKLFYLADTTQSHVYFDNSSAYVPFPGYYNWQKVCLSSSGGTLNITVQSTSPGSGFVCIGSVDTDDVSGGHAGDCSAYTDKMWIKLE